MWENIEEKNEEQLKMNESKQSKQLGINLVIDVFDDDFSQEAKNIIYISSNQEKSISYKRLNFKRDKNFLFDFRDYRSLKELSKYIYYKKFAIKEAERVQNEINVVLDKLKNTIQESLNKIFWKIQKKFDGKEMMIKAFNHKIFSLYYEKSYFEDEISDENGLINYEKLN